MAKAIHYRAKRKDAEMITCSNCQIVFPKPINDPRECPWCHEDIPPHMANTMSCDCKGEARGQTDPSPLFYS